jgi:hypothetical protein
VEVEVEDVSGRGINILNFRFIVIVAILFAQRRRISPRWSAPSLLPRLRYRPGPESFLDLAVYYYATTTKFMDKSITSNAFVASCDADRPLTKDARNVSVINCLTRELCVVNLTWRAC